MKRDTGIKLALLLLFSFAILNWLLLSLAEKIGPPDFYKLYEVAEKLYSGDLKIGITPPLFPLIMYPLGKLLTLFFLPTEAFIIAGRIISLAAGFGVLWFTYLLLKNITGKWALTGLVFLIISPWYLKLLAFPITDMLYLFFVTAAFYAFLNKSHLKLSIPAVTGGVATRFEGVLLILSGFLNYFIPAGKGLKKRNTYILLTTAALVLGAFLFFLLFAPRIFHHLKDIILPQKSYLYLFLHPLEFFNVIYGNILFFIPHEFPYLLKLTVLILLFVFFVYGVCRLFKRDKHFTIAMVVYEFLFLVAKGYINPEDPEREFRRIFSGLWIFYFISFIGCYFLLKKIKPHKTLTHLTLLCGGLFLIVMAVYRGLITVPYVFLAMLLLFPLVYPLKNLSLGKIPKYLAIIVLAVFVFQVYHSAYQRSEYYVVSYANKAAYASAQWLNFSRLKQDAVVLSYTNDTMINYYLNKEKAALKNIQRIHFTVPIRNTPENRDLFIQFFFKELQDKKVDYIIFDNYVVQKPEFLGINDVQRLLYEERENKRYFHIKKNLFYKGQNVGYVLKPVDNR